MKHLIRLYPARWRQRYGAELSRLLDDLQPMPLHDRLSTGVDLLRGALDAHCTTRPPMHPSTRAALRRAILVAVVVWAALSVEIVLSNVVFPTTEDNDGVSVVISYLAVFAALGITGALAARVTTNWRTLALAGAVAGGLIGALTIATFLVIDNAFLDIISQQQGKIDGLANSGMTSMRAYVNASLLPGLVFLSGFFALVGAALATAVGLNTHAHRAAEPDAAEPGGDASPSK